MKIEPIDSEYHKYRTSTSIYTNETVDKIENSNLAPMLFGTHSSTAMSDLAELESMGWKLPDGSLYTDPSQDIAYDNWKLMEKYF